MAFGLQTLSAEVWGPGDWPAWIPQWPWMPAWAGSELHFWKGSDTGWSGRYVLSGCMCGLSRGRSFWETSGGCKVLRDGQVIPRAFVASPGVLAMATRPHSHVPLQLYVARSASGDLEPEAHFVGVR